MRYTYYLTLLIAGCSLLFGSIAKAQSLQELLPAMLSTHERAQASLKKEEAGKVRYRGSKSAWYPKLDAWGDVSREELDTNTSSSKTEMTRNIQQVKATQLLWDFGRANGNITTAEGHLLQSKYTNDFTRQGLLLEGTKAYLELIKSTRTLQFALESEGNIKRQTGIEESLVQKGAGLSSNVLQAKAQLASITAKRVVNEGRLENSRSRFRAVFGFSPLENVTKVYPIPNAPYTEIPATLDEAINIALQENPSLHVARSLIMVHEGQEAAALSNFFPTFNAFWEWWRKENEGGRENVIQYEQRYGIEFKQNFFNGGADLNAYRAAKREKTAAFYSVKDAERTIEESVRVAWQNLITASAQADWYKNQANIQEEFLKLARKERKLGNRSLLDVLSAEVDLNNAQSEAVAAEINKMIQCYTLIHAMGRLNLGLYIDS